MKVAFLITTVHDIGGTAGAVVTQANALGPRHEVEILSVYGDEGHHFPLDPRVTVTDLVDLAATRSRSPACPDPGRGAAGTQPTMTRPAPTRRSTRWSTSRWRRRCPIWTPTYSSR